MSTTAGWPAARGWHRKSASISANPLTMYSNVEYQDNEYSNPEYTGGETMRAMTATEAIIRPATEADVDTLRVVIARANESFRGLVAEELFASYLASAMDVERRLVEADVLVAELDGGTSSAPSRSTAMPETRACRSCSLTGRRGSGPRPLTHWPGAGASAKRWWRRASIRATDVGATGLGLHTAMFMVAAVTIYERCGFRAGSGLRSRWSQFFPARRGEVEPAIAYLRAVAVSATMIRSTLARLLAELARRSAHPIGTTSGVRLR